MTPNNYIKTSGNWYFPTPNRSTVPGPNGTILTGGTVLNPVTDAGQVAALESALASIDPIPAGAVISTQGVQGQMTASQDSPPLYSILRGVAYVNYADTNGKNSSIRKQL